MNMSGATTMYTTFSTASAKGSEASGRVDSCALCVCVCVGMGAVHTHTHTHTRTDKALAVVGAEIDELADRVSAKVAQPHGLTVNQPCA